MPSRKAVKGSKPSRAEKMTWRKWVIFTQEEVLFIKILTERKETCIHLSELCSLAFTFRYNVCFMTTILFATGYIYFGCNFNISWKMKGSLGKKKIQGNVVTSQEPIGFLWSSVRSALPLGKKNLVEILLCNRNWLLEETGLLIVLVKIFLKWKQLFYQLFLGIGGKYYYMRRKRRKEKERSQVLVPQPAFPSSDSIYLQTDGCCQFPWGSMLKIKTKAFSAFCFTHPLVLSLRGQKCSPSASHRVQWGIGAAFSILQWAEQRAWLNVMPHLSQPLRDLGRNGPAGRSLRAAVCLSAASLLTNWPEAAIWVERE